MSKKKLLVPILAGLCLMLALFPSVIVSQPLPEQTEYNPWCDVNDDGKIRVDDILNVSMRFGSDGDPTKYVNVVNWPDPLNVSVVSPLDENENVRVNSTCCSSSNSISNGTYKDAVEITVLDWVARHFTNAYGVGFFGTLDFPFVFSPSPSYAKDINITSLWVSILASKEPSPGCLITFDITINSQHIQSVEWPLEPYDHVYSRSFGSPGEMDVQRIPPVVPTVV